MADTTSYTYAAESPDIAAAKTELMKAALNAGTPILPGYQVAGLQPNQTEAIKLGQQGIGAYQPYIGAANTSMAEGAGNLGEASDILRGADTRNQYSAAQQAMNMGAGNLQQGQGAANMATMAALNAGQSFTQPGAAQAYMSPYMQNVVDIQKREAARQAGIQGTQQQAQATQAGAFGGGRDAIMRAEAARNLGTQMNDIQAQGLQNSYQQAQNQFNTEQNAKLQQSSALQGIGGLQGNLASQYGTLGQGIGNLAAQQFGIGNQMAQGIGSLGTQLGNLGTQQMNLGQTAQTLGQNDVSQLYNLGALQQKQQQAVLDAQRATAAQTALQPQQRLAFISDIYRGAPSSQMAVSQQSQPTPSPFQQIAGLGTGLISGAAAASKSGLF
jgi:hypothetical protein